MNSVEDIKQKALRLGFDLIGITDASPIEAEQVESLKGWLKSGFAGRMDYMHRNFEKRINPAQLLKNAQSVIAVGLNYRPPPIQNSKPKTQKSSFGRVANYAQYEDYHLFMKKQLRQLTDFISSIACPVRDPKGKVINGAGESLKFKICVDSVPLAERALSVRAGLGFIGKNRMLINPELGPQILLGEIITNLKLEPDEPVTDNCSNCDKCIAACPTGALRNDGQFDASKCISYLTIEYKGQISSGLARKIDNWLFGCDECVLACPYQEDSPVCENKRFKFYSDRAQLNLRQILDLSQEEFKTQFTDSVIKRLGLEGLKRNAQICLANITSQKDEPAS